MALLSQDRQAAEYNLRALADRNPHMVGATVHMPTAGVDAGDILLHAVPPIEGCTDAFLFTMTSAKAAQDALVQRIVDGSLAALEPVPQDRSLEIRYSRSAQFTDDVAAAFLAHQPSIDSISQVVESKRGSFALIGV